MKKLMLITALLCGSAHAEFWTGNDLLGKMQSSEVLDRMLALGYVMGAFDAYRGTDHCPPDNVTAGQVRDMVRQHLEATPGTRQFTADAQVKFVLSRAWPCANRRGGQSL